jgi:N-formylglutamate amidohydrolase
MNDIYLKEESSPYIFTFPHSGEKLTSDMPWQLTPEAQKFLPNVDWHLNELYGFLKKYNVNIVSTAHSRYVVDVNRPPNAEKFGNYRRSLVYSTNTWDEEIYAIPPNDEEIDRRIKRYYEPFHQELEILITKKVKEFGKVYLIDLHSFMGPISEDVCLGNRQNSTCSEAFLEKVYGAFDAEGFETVKNKVFIGGYITKSYAVKEVVEALQIELRYTNYIEPQDLDVRQVPRKETNLFQETAFRLERVFEKIGIEKSEDTKVESMIKKENLWNNKFLWFLALMVALFFSLIEN